MKSFIEYMMERDDSNEYADLTPEQLKKKQKLFQSQVSSLESKLASVITGSSGDKKAIKAEIDSIKYKLTKIKQALN